MPDAPAIEVAGVTKRFGDVMALAGVDLCVAPGTVFGLLGPNGAGKTTTVRILTTIIRPDTGTARVLGHDVVRDAARVRSNIGLAGQYAAVDEQLTGRENLRLVGRLTHRPKAETTKRSEELLDLFDLVDAADRPVKTYSGGMRRRIDLAASLVHRPPVLFLDEPTTGLDPRSRNDLWDLMRELVSEGTTLLLTTQYLEEADQFGDRIAVIDQGRVIAEGTSSELKSQLGSTVLEVSFADGDDGPPCRFGAQCGSGPTARSTAFAFTSRSRTAPERRWRRCASSTRARHRGRRPGPARAQPRRRVPLAHRPPRRRRSVRRASGDGGSGPRHSSRPAVADGGNSDPPAPVSGGVA